MTISREQFETIKVMPFYKGKVVSDSMFPIIKIGDEVVVDVGNFDIKKFDIIVVYMNGKLVCHYLWQMNRFLKPILLQTRNMSGKLDYPVSEEDYLGKVLSHRLSLWRKLRIIF